MPELEAAAGCRVGAGAAGVGAGAAGAGAGAAGVGAGAAAAAGAGAADAAVLLTAGEFCLGVPLVELEPLARSVLGLSGVLGDVAWGRMGLGTARRVFAAVSGAGDRDRDRDRDIFSIAASTEGTSIVLACAIFPLL